MLEAIGFFDERFFLYYEETDLCLRAHRNGWGVYFLPDAGVTHIGGASSRTRSDLDFDEGGAQVLRFRVRSEFLYFRKNSGLRAVLTNALVEAGWHALRLIANPGAGGRGKRAYSRAVVRNVRQALHDTRWGLESPPIPW
jgi:GT2 family glycosyltransferase